MPIRLEGMTLYTVKDIEELLGVGNSTVRRYISDGRLKGRKLARRWYVPSESLLDYFRSVDLEPPAELLEKLKALDEKMDQKNQRRNMLRLARATAPAHPPTPTPTYSTAAEENLSEVEKLLRQARRLKEEAARLERTYAEPGRKG